MQEGLRWLLGAIFSRALLAAGERLMFYVLNEEFAESGKYGKSRIVCEHVRVLQYAYDIGHGAKGSYLRLRRVGAPDVDLGYGRANWMTPDYSNIRSWR
jgi:hypothetical protein